ncbi:MAG TPA: PA14 domain-containing protein, partial [Candidatus Limnocylindria bacterium]|nr:PA14 domain-containing protein [Candidatus Limnocylindria bacterium]
VTGAGLRHISLATLDDNTSGIRAARIKHPKYSQYYWLEYRSGRSWMDATEASQSLGLRWGSPNGSEAWWLNIGANRLGANRLALGHTFSDPVGDVHITPVSILSTSPATLDVVVAIGPFPSNNIPTATLAASRTAAGVGGSVKFTVTASDADGDSLAYGWDFGGDGADGPVAQNTNVVTHVFATAGYYNIRCQVSDMKGGVSTESVLVKIGSPTGFTVAGKVMAADGSPLEGIQVRADDTHYAFTDSDGAYSITEVPAGTYSLAASDPVSDDFIFESWLAAPLVISRNVSGANFTTLNRSDTSGMRVEYYSDNNFGSLQQVARNSAVRFPSTVVPGAKSVRWTGLFNAPVAGPYLLHATGSGSVRLIVNGDSSGGLTALGTNQEATAYVRLSEGQPCSLQVEFSAADTNAVLDLQWTTPAGGLSRFTPEKLYPSIGGLRGSYYANKSLTNLVFSRLDPIVHFPTGVTPGPRLPGDSYSVRWTGKVLTRNAGLYKFTTTSDDGVRLWVDGKRMVNAWTDHAPRDDSGSLSLAANKAYDVVLEYYQGTGGAEISLQWTPPGGVREVIPARQLMPSYSGLWAEYYNVETLDGSPGVTQLDPQVDFDYASDAPTPGIDSTTYSGRWLGWLNAPTNGTYQFTVWADDATRLWVNGQKIIDNWGFQGAVELTGSINLSTNAPVPIRLEMQQIGGASGVRLGWKPPGSTNSVIPSDRLQPQRAGLWAQYFDNDQLAGVPVAGLYRSTVSDDYAATGLPPGITSNPFSIRWTGRVNASATISHRIYLVSTGGARLYWDGKLVIDDWTLHTKHEASFQTNLLTGVWHDLVVEYRNQTGNGLAQLSWARTGLTRQAIPSFNLQPPTATLSPIAAHLVGTPGQLKLQWAADLGPLPVLGTSDLGTSNGWPTEAGAAYLSNGLWYQNLDEGTNTSRFFQLNPAGN